MSDRYLHSSDPSGGRSWREIVGVQSHGRGYPRSYTTGTGRCDQSTYEPASPPSAAESGARLDIMNFESMSSLGSGHRPAYPENTRMRGQNVAETYSDENENEWDTLEEEDRNLHFEEQDEHGYVRHRDHTVRSAATEMYDDATYSESESSFSIRNGARAPRISGLVPPDFGARQQYTHRESTSTSHSLPSLARYMASIDDKDSASDVEGPSPGVTKYGARQEFARRARPRHSTTQPWTHGNTSIGDPGDRILPTWGIPTTRNPIHRAAKQPTLISSPRVPNQLPGIREHFGEGFIERTPSILGHSTSETSKYSIKQQPVRPESDITSCPALWYDGRGSSTEVRGGPPPHNDGEVANLRFAVGNMGTHFDHRHPQQSQQSPRSPNFGNKFAGSSDDTTVSVQPQVTKRRRQWHPTNHERAQEMMFGGFSHSGIAKNVPRTRKGLINQTYYFNQKERDRDEARARARVGGARNVPKLREREPGEGGQKIKWTAEAGKWVQDRVYCLQSQSNNQMSLSKATDKVAAELEVGNPGMVFTGGGLRHQLKRWDKANPAGR